MVLKGEVDVVVRALYGGLTVDTEAMVLLGELHTVSESRCILRTHTDHVQRQYGHPNFSPSCAGRDAAVPRRSPRASTREKGPPRRKEGLLSARIRPAPLGDVSPGFSCPLRPRTSSSPPESPGSHVDVFSWAAPTRSWKKKTQTGKNATVDVS